MVATVLGWVSWLVVINKLSPFLSGNLALAFFYSSLLVALTGTFALVNYYLRIVFVGGENFPKHFNAAVRQGVLLASMVCLGLAFQRLRVLTWWDAALMLMIVLLIERYFVRRE